MKDFIYKHPQLAMAFVQITLAQMAGWDFMPKVWAAVFSSVAALFQAWLALFYSTKEKEKDEVPK